MSNENSGNPGGGGEVSGLLVQGFKAAKENRRDEAYNIFCDVVRRDPNNELGWLYRAATTDDLSEAYVCLQRVLSINPNNEKAQRGIERIQARLNSEEGEETPAATEQAAPVTNRPPAPAQFGEAEVVSGMRPGASSGYPANNQGQHGIYQTPEDQPRPGMYQTPDNQATARYPYEESGVAPAQFYNGASASQLPDTPQSTPPPYRPDPQSRLPWETDETQAAQPMNYNYQPDQSAGYNYQPDQSAGYNPDYNPADPELVDEPLEVSQADGRDRTRDRLRSGRGQENPRIGNNTNTNTGRKAGAGLAPVFGRMAGARDKGRAAFGSGATATGLDQVGKEEARRRQRPLILLGLLLLVIGIIILAFILLRSKTDDNNGQQAANPTDTVAGAIGGTVAGGPTPIITAAGTPSGAVSVPVVGNNTPSAAQLTAGAGSGQATNGAGTKQPTNGAIGPANTTQAAPPPPATNTLQAGPGPVNPTAVVPPANTAQAAPPPPPANTTPVVPAPAPGASPRPAVYVVKPGDNLTNIARQNSTSIDAIKAANRSITGTTIFGGNRLVIPVSRPDYRGRGGAILAKGETLQTLADRFQVSVDDIVRLNGLGSPNEAKEGDAILLP